MMARVGLKPHKPMKKRAIPTLNPRSVVFFGGCFRALWIASRPRFFTSASMCLSSFR